MLAHSIRSSMCLLLSNRDPKVLTTKMAVHAKYETDKINSLTNYNTDNRYPKFLTTEIGVQEQRSTDMSTTNPH